jgi:glutathione S-transferase
MIKLFQWPSKSKLPNTGLFCMKLETYLKLQKIEYKVEPTIKIEQSPKKTMPFIERNGTLMADSQLIIEMLEKESSKPLDGHLTLTQKSHATAYRLMLENQLLYILMHYRWNVDEGWNVFSRQIFEGAPGIIRIIFGGKMRKESRAVIHTSGISRHSEKDILEMGELVLSACSQQLGENKYFFGSQPSTLDCMLFSMVSNILYAGVPNPLISSIQKKYANLEKFAEAMAQEVFGRSFS